MKYLQTVIPALLAFTGSTHGSVDNLNDGNFVQTDRQYFMKFQYLFRI